MIMLTDMLIIKRTLQQIRTCIEKVFRTNVVEPRVFSSGWKYLFMKSLSLPHLDLLAETFSTMAAAELVIVARYLLMLKQSLGRDRSLLKMNQHFWDIYLSVLEFSLTHLAFGFMFDFLQRFCLQRFLVLQSLKSMMKLYILIFWRHGWIQMNLSQICF